MCFCLGQRWHPDRCSASGNSKFVEEAKKKFQAIQQAYSGNLLKPFIYIFLKKSWSSNCQIAIIRKGREFFFFFIMIYNLCVTVLSDTNKRFLYDVGVDDSDDDENVCFLFGFLFMILSCSYIYTYVLILI